MSLFMDGLTDGHYLHSYVLLFLCLLRLLADNFYYNACGVVFTCTAVRCHLPALRFAMLLPVLQG